MSKVSILYIVYILQNLKILRDMSLFSGGGGGYQFFWQGSQKILTLPLNTNEQIVTLPQP